MTNPWFDARRAWFTTGLLHLFLAVQRDYYHIHQLYLTTGEPSFAAVEHLVGNDNSPGRLWRLKDLCHTLWRDEDSASPEGRLFDWIIGSLFHEAMKLKENLYLREHYQPLIDQRVTNDHGQAPPSPARLFCATEGARLIARSAADITRQIDNLGLLLGQANYLLRCMLPHQTANGLLLRLLAEEENLTMELWGESPRELFADMFDGCPEKGYLAAAASFATSHWFERAAVAGQKALALRPDSSEARLLLARVSALATVFRETTKSTEASP